MITSFELFVGKEENAEVHLGSKIEHNDNIYIAWFCKNWGFCFINETTFDYPKMLETTHTYRTYNWMYRVKKHVKIVGNIYENSELQKPKPTAKYSFPTDEQIEKKAEFRQKSRNPINKADEEFICGFMEGAEWAISVVLGNKG